MKICFASIVGRPNVGKSSLINAIVGYNVAIVTNTAQTTRDQITGIYTEDDFQLIFTDTPGIHKAKNKLGESLNKAAFESVKNVDVILFLSPADEKIAKGDQLILDKIANHPHKIAVISKVSKIKGNPQLLNDKINQLNKYNFDYIISTDINNQASIYSLIDLIKDNFAYQDSFQYDPDYVTDKSVRFIAKEIIRESAINLLYEELPHSIVVEVIEFNESDPEHLYIDANIYVKKDSQKGMVIGKNASKIKQISQTARFKISQQLQTKVTLTIKVKVAKKWNDDSKQLSKFGY